MPVWKACDVLGHDVVYRIASTYIRLKESTSNSKSNIINSNNRPTTTTTTDDDIRTLVAALCYNPDGDTAGTNRNNSNDTDYYSSSLGLESPPSGAADTLNWGSSAGIPNQQINAALPDSIVNAWQKWLTHPGLIVENKSMFVQFAVPATIQPHPGPSGHIGLFDCWIYALQGHAVQNANPANTMSNNSYYLSNQQGNNRAGATTAPTMWIPDIIILFAVAKDYRDFRVRQKTKIIQYRRARQQQRQLQQQQQKQHEQRAGESGDSSDKSETNQDEKQKQSSAETIENDLSSMLELSGLDKKIVWTMATLAYRFYDSYQKKGTVQRDTVHRFLTDVHGEESYKQPKNKALLDTIFAMPNNNIAGGLNPNTNNSTNLSPNALLQVAVTEQQFCKRVLDTIKNDDIFVTHLLLDWIALLGCTMMPLQGRQYDTITAYIDAIQRQGTKVPVCQLYNLADCRLYEIKRKFHSMVAKSTSTYQTVIAGNPMASDASSGVVQSSSPPVPSTATTTSSMHSSESGGGGNGSKLISSQYFVQVLSASNDELGAGGYLPASIAILIFQAGCTDNNNNNNAGIDTGSPFEDIQNECGGESSSFKSNAFPHNITKIGWGLQNVLQFGCMAVRHDTSKPQSDPDTPLLRFLFMMFQLSVPHTYSDDNPVPDKRILNRKQVGRMIQLLSDYAVFRRNVDRSPKDDIDDDTDNDDINIENNDYGTTTKNGLQALTTCDDLNAYEINTMLDYASCSLLGLVPSNYKPNVNDGHSNSQNIRLKKSSSSNTQRMTVPLKVLVDYALKGNTTTPDRMTFDEFVVWHSTKMTETGPRTRLGPLMTELRLVAAVQFGIPPVLASMEITLIAEIERRHKFRYPQTELSRRGPRGTIWYIIDSLWFTSWTNHVKKTAGTPLDGQDGRGSTGNPDRTRTLNRIRNAGLLVENGSLALRPDIRWKHDYEILPPLAWAALQAWYDGGPPIHRSVVKYISNNAPTSPHQSTSLASTRGGTAGSGGTIPTENEIELYPLFVTVYLCDAASRGEARPFQQNFQLSRVSPILVMLVQLCKELDVNPDQVRLWVLGSRSIANDLGGVPVASSSFSPSTSMLSLSSDTSSQATRQQPGGGSSSLADDWILSIDNSIIEQMKRRGMTTISKDSPIVLLLELKDRDSGLWPRGIDGKEWTSRRQRHQDSGNSSASSLPSDQQVGSSDLGDGIVGLYNMG
jgi:DUSP domain